MWYTERRGYGFIRAHDTEQNVFFHRVNLMDASRVPQAGDRVEFRLRCATPSNRALDVNIISPVTRTNIPTIQSPHRETSPTKPTVKGVPVSLAKVQRKLPVKETSNPPPIRVHPKSKRANPATETPQASASTETPSSTHVSVNPNVKHHTSKPRKTPRKSRRGVTHFPLPVEESGAADRSPALDNESSCSDENSGAEDPPIKDDELATQEENCSPLCSLGQVQRQKTGPSSFDFPSLTPSTSTSTDTSHRHPVGCY